MEILTSINILDADFLRVNREIQKSPNLIGAKLIRMSVKYQNK